MKVTRKILEIDEELCDGCGQCVPSCAEKAIQIVDGKAKVVDDKFCDGLGACLGECPQGALRLITREADEFDEEAVEERIKTAQVEGGEDAPMPRACPSAGLAQFTPGAGPSEGEFESALSHWPVQIMLVPPDAPFLKGADLLVVADCVPVAYPNFHGDFLKGKKVMMGCPKFDNVNAYADKFAKICEGSGVKSITTLMMEVPCCSALPKIVREGVKRSGKEEEIPLQEVIISRRGKVVARREQGQQVIKESMTA